jgi:hypothetical protein
MKTFEKQHFEQFYDRDSGAIFENMVFRNCEFQSSAISITTNPRNRSTFRNIIICKCTERSCDVRASRFEEVVVDGLRTSDLLIAFGAVYKHVVLKGRIDRLMLSAMVSPSSYTPAIQRSFDEDAEHYYSNVDWALDISQGEFKELSFRGIPCWKVIRDPETQVLITRRKAMEGGWRDLDLSGTYWADAIELFLEEGANDTILVAGKREREFRQLKKGLDTLRKAGIAEPD